MIELDEAWESERLKYALSRLTGLLAKKGYSRHSQIAQAIGVEDDYLRRNIRGKVKRVNPVLIRLLAELADVSTTEIFAELGWLAPSSEEAENLTGILPRKAALSAVSAAVAAVVEADPDSAERFRVVRSSVVSGGLYRSVTNHVAEFLLAEGERPWPRDRAISLADGLGIEVGELLMGDADFEAVRLELKVRTNAALRDCVEYSWQGGADHLTWRPIAATWPTHLLVHDAVGGSQLPAAPLPVGGFADDTLVVVGGRHSLGLAAPILAEALGRQFVLIRPDVGITDQGDVFPVRRDDIPGRSQAWVDVALRINAAHESGTPWPSVVLVRPAVFTSKTLAGQRALRLLASIRGRVVYARPPADYVKWWGRRIAGNHEPGAYDADSWIARTLAHYDRIAAALADRPGNRTLLLDVPEASEALDPHHPRVPAEIIDWTARVAWTTARWLAKGDVPTLARGRLAAWRRDLESDLLADVPPLTDLR